MPANSVQVVDRGDDVGDVNLRLGCLVEVQGQRIRLSCSVKSAITPARVRVAAVASAVTLAIAMFAGPLAVDVAELP